LTRFFTIFFVSSGTAISAPPSTTDKQASNKHGSVRRDQRAKEQENQGGFFAGEAAHLRVGERRRVGKQVRGGEARGGGGGGGEAARALLYGLKP